MKVYQIREKNPTQTISKVFISTDRGVYMFYLLELPWMDNVPNDSCIPTGQYKLVKRQAHENGSRFSYPHLEVIDVPDRWGIKWHIANYTKELRGCGAP